MARSTRRSDTIMGNAILHRTRPKLEAVLHNLLHRAMALAEATRVRRAAWRTPLLAIAALIFVIGSAISLYHLDLSARELRWEPLALLVAVFVPITIAYSALNMMVMAKAADARLMFWQGVRVTAYAQVAELLPVPGGIVVRTAALIRAGGGGRQSAELVLAFSVLWVSCAAAGAGIALAGDKPAGMILGWGGAATTFAVTTWIGLRYGGAVAFTALMLRLFGIALTAARLATSFAVIGVALPYVSSFTFAFATIAGSAASIAPGGLGIGESLSALLAGSAGVVPAAAFAAAALSRVCGIVVNMLIAAAFTLAGIRPEAARVDVPKPGSCAPAAETKE